MKTNLVFIVILTLIAMGWRFNPPVQRGYPEIPVGWPQPVFDFTSQPLQQNKIRLGRILFYDPILSRDSSISCASCHSPYNAFAHTDHALSHGIGDSIGTRNAPALQLLAWQNYFMWDGAFKSLDEQSIFPVTHPDEMGEKIENIRTKFRRSARYRKLSAQVYGDSVLSIERMKESLRQFLLTILSSNNKYDSMLTNRCKFTSQEENGYQLFLKNCNGCHTEPLFTSMDFGNNGLTANERLMDVGRMRITGNPKDSMQFKIPSLRNIEYTFPYMHDGRFSSLREVVTHYTTLKQTLYLRNGKQLPPITLSEREKVDLIAFLLTLSDRKMLFNTEYGFPKEILP